MDGTENTVRITLCDLWGNKHRYVEGTSLWIAANKPRYQYMDTPRHILGESPVSANKGGKIWIRVNMVKNI